jgi:hypothetical protein
MEKVKKDKTDLGKLIEKIKGKVPEVAELIGDVLPNNGMLGIVKNMIDKSTISEEEKQSILREIKEYEFKEMELYIKDVQDARDMQKIALQQDDKFSKWFVPILSIFWSLAALAYIFGITFFDIPEGKQDIVHTVLGFLLGTAVSLILNYYFGSSKGSKEKFDSMMDQFKLKSAA